MTDLWVGLHNALKLSMNKTAVSFHAWIWNRRFSYTMASSIVGWGSLNADETLKFVSDAKWKLIGHKLRKKPCGIMKS